MKIRLKTGLGYIEKDGKVIEKFELPVGEHNFPDGVNVIEVNSKAELEAVEIYKAPVEESVEIKLKKLREEIIDKMLADEDITLLKQKYKQLRSQLQSV